MKSAQEVAEMMRSHGGSFQSFIELANIIQADAYRAGLLRSAQVCRDLMAHRASFLSESVTIHRCAQAIEAEAQKGGQ